MVTDDVDEGTTSEAVHVGEEILVATDDVDAGTTSEVVHEEEISVAMDDVDAGTTSEADEEEPMDLLSMSFMFDDDEDDVTDEGLDIPIEIPSTSASSVNYDGDNTVEEETVTSIRRAVKRKAQESTEKAAKRYANQYNKRLKVCQDFKEDDTISILIPSNERSSTDLLRLPGVIIKVKGTSSKTYTIGTAHGILSTDYRTADLQIHSGQVDIKRDNIITLRKAVMLTNPTTLHTTKSCNCKGKCVTLRCPCKKAQITCSTHCHLSKPCENGEK